MGRFGAFLMLLAIIGGMIVVTVGLFAFAWPLGVISAVWCIAVVASAIANSTVGAR
jgi:hypothetical protein